MTTTTQVLQAPAPVKPPVDTELFVAHLLGIYGYTATGMWRAAQAFLQNYNSVQGNSMQLMQLSEAVQTEQMGAANNYITLLQGYNVNITEAIAAYNDPNSPHHNDQTWLQNQLTQNQGNASVANTMYNSTNQFWSGLNNGINQTSSDATQTESLDMQMFQQSILALQQQLANAM